MATISRPFKYAILDALLLFACWVIIYFQRYHSLPGLTRGPLVLISIWIFAQYLMGTYSAMTARRLDVSRQLLNSFLASALVFVFAASLTLARGETSLSTMGRGFLVPLLLLSLSVHNLFVWTSRNSHLWMPQQCWLFFVSASERAVLSQSIEVGGCAIPCGIEWRSASGLASLPSQLPALLGLDGVVVGSENHISAEDRTTLLAWQDEGLRLLSVSGWAEAFLHRLPPALLPHTWAERVELFRHIAGGPGPRLKRLGDLVLSGLLICLLIPLVVFLRQPLHKDQCIGRHGRPFLRLRFDGSSHFSSLPQLINVWRGEMSLVGPRPLTPAAMQDFELRFPGADLRQWTRPGMTGWGRIAGPPPEETDALAWELGRDLYYLRNHSLFLDLRLLLTSFLRLLIVRTS